VIERAVEAAVLATQTTPDIGGKLGTKEVGDWVARHVRGRG
jgi:isocitrate/isopropylmalate dehydrogenase